MVRNTILGIATLAVLLLLFVGYHKLVNKAVPAAEEVQEDNTTLGETHAVGEDDAVTVGPVTVAPTEEIGWIQYDKSGRPTGGIWCKSWEKVPGSQNDVRVYEPRLVQRLGSGMMLTVTADEGQLTVDWVQNSQFEPKNGRLDGNARIVLDRATDDDRTPLDQRPEDSISIEMDGLSFDLEIGELRSESTVRVDSTDFRVSGTGLHLLWNEDENRVDKLLINSAGQMVVGGDILSSMGNTLDGRAERDEQRDRQPRLVEVRPRRKRVVAYNCTLTGDVQVDYYEDEQRAGALRADELILRFDSGGPRGLEHKEEPTSAPTSAPASAPTSQPADTTAKWLVIQWSGHLELHPEPVPKDWQQPRRQIEATGHPAIVTLPKGELKCQRLILHEETKRLWLYPEEGQRVELQAGPRLAVSAQNIFADLENDIIKLIGDVYFRTGGGEGPNRHANELDIRCDLWAELHLETGPDQSGVEDVFGNPMASRPPKEAVFVGGVRVNYQHQKLRAEELTATFAPRERSATPAGDEASETPPASDLPEVDAMLDRAVATGQVVMTAVDADELGWRQTINRNLNTVKRSLLNVVSRSARRSNSQLADGENRTLRCERMTLDFDEREGRVGVSKLHSLGAVEIDDRHSSFGAHGRELIAEFSPTQELELAKVIGSASAPAAVRARGYALRGPEIQVDNRARTLHVDGRSHLAFSSQRTFQGAVRSSAETVTVTSSESLHIAERENTVRFRGDVMAGTGNEQLLADELILLIEDIVDVQEPIGFSRLSSAWGNVRSALRGDQRDAGGDSLFGFRSDRGQVRKELGRIRATSAEMRSMIYGPDDPQPLVYQAVMGPELEIDVLRRWVRTTGNTTLLMTDRRLETADSAASAEALGIPSALLSGGPSQAVMTCTRSLVYVLGLDGPDRRDSVILEGNVWFQYLTGQEMKNIEGMLPQLKSNPDLVKQLENRNTYLVCDRLEGIFAVRKDDQQQDRISRWPKLSLALLNASGNVRMRDQQDAVIREVYAHQLEFDRENGMIRVLGSPLDGIDAKVYDENRETGRFSMPVSGPEVVIDMKNGTIRTQRIRGRTQGQ